jgi:hypothetical protein
LEASTSVCCESGEPPSTECLSSLFLNKVGIGTRRD